MTATPALPEPAPEKRRLPSPKIRQAIALLVEGDCKTITAAAAKVGLARETFSRALHQRHVSAFMLEKIQRHLAVGGARGAARMVKLVDAAKSERTLFESSKFLLGVAGIRPASDANVSVNIDVKAGFVIDLSEPGDKRQMKVVSPVEAPLKSSPPSNSEIAG
jgi:hypothetical protein